MHWLHASTSTGCTWMVPPPSQNIPESPAQGTRNCKTPLTVQPVFCQQRLGSRDGASGDRSTPVALGNKPSTSLRYFRVFRHGLGGPQGSSCTTHRRTALSQCSCSPQRPYIYPVPGSPTRCCTGPWQGRGRAAASPQTRLNASHAAAERLGELGSPTAWFLQHIETEQ